MFANLFDHEDLLELVWDPYFLAGTNDAHLIRVAVGVSVLIDQQQSIESFEMMVVVFKNARKIIEASRLKEVVKGICVRDIQSRIESMRNDSDFIKSS